MSGSLTCRNGHRWAPTPGPAPGAEGRCPACGAPPLDPHLVPAGPWWVWVLAVEAILLAAYAAGLGLWSVSESILLLGAAGAVAILAAARAVARFRARRMEAVCAAIGFTYADEVSSARLSAFGPFHLFTPGRQCWAYHLMTGLWKGRDLALFELRKPRVGTATSEPRTVVVVADAPAGGEGVAPGGDLARHFRAGGPGAGAIQGAAPEGRPAAPAAAWDLSLEGLELRLEPVGAANRLGQWLGLQDVLFPDHAEFSHRYRVSGPCEETIRRAFRPEVLDFFAEHPGWSVEVLGGRLLAHRQGPCAAAECPGLLSEVAQMHRVLMRAWAESHNA
jgi:hypothetical protein